MKISCVCGCDCTEFVAQHEIPGAARFACPVCDVSVYAIDDSVAASQERSLRCSEQPVSRFELRYPTRTLVTRNWGA